MTHKELEEKTIHIVGKLFGDLQEVMKNARSTDEHWFTFIKSKLDLLTLEEQEALLLYLFDQKLTHAMMSLATELLSRKNKPL